MIQQAVDLRQESQSLFDIMSPLATDAFATPTQFKGWTFDHVLGHLHVWNQAADLSVTNEAAFVEFLDDVMAALKDGSLRAFEDRQLKGLSGPELLHTWYGFTQKMTTRLGQCDPKQRVKWAGPDMSIRSSLTARLMETWAHGLAVFDALGIQRHDEDRIKNIVILGVNTYGWTFINRKLPVPDPMPFLRLRSPTGEFWEWGDAALSDRIEGSATGFCQTVTQVRNVADTDLVVRGENAQAWMQLAQCFAGPPVPPPQPGSRFVQSPGASGSA